MAAECWQYPSQLDIAVYVYKGMTQSSACWIDEILPANLAAIPMIAENRRSRVVETIVIWH